MPVGRDSDVPHVRCGRGWNRGGTAIDVQTKAARRSGRLSAFPDDEDQNLIFTPMFKLLYFWLLSLKRPL